MAPNGINNDTKPAEGVQPPTPTGTEVQSFWKLLTNIIVAMAEISWQMHAVKGIGESFTNILRLFYPELRFAVLLAVLALAIMALIIPKGLPPQMDLEEATAEYGVRNALILAYGGYALFLAFIFVALASVVMASVVWHPLQHQQEA